MRKRDFLKTLGLGLAGVAAGPLAWGEAKRPERLRPPKNWIWISPDKADRPSDEWKRMLESIRLAGIDAIVPEVWDGQHAYWDSKHLPTKTDWLGKLLPLTHNHGLELHAWMWIMPCRIPAMMKKHPDWFNVNALGESTAVKPAYVDHYRFLDPARPEVREWVTKTVVELADMPRLTGVHLDYVRYPDRILAKSFWKKYNVIQDKVHPQFDYGYTDYNRKLFKKKFGTDPLKLEDPANHKEWTQYRLDTVTELVNDHVVPAARHRGRIITAAVFPPTVSRYNVLQDWSKWKLDAFLPMLYNTFYQEGPDWVKKETQEAVASVTVPIYSGLYVPDLDPAGVTSVVRASIDGGAGGVSLFSHGGMTDEKWKAFQEGVKV
jgi:uncharacterized lipoprotein YddW (UPF0748 family)